ncbi:hypothetical protein, partial [Pontiella sp.]|uniref:hypothetical protein n=1 Tax=Pontiella sp. TaxID=2837462 RepID=UPI003562D2F5
ATDPSISLRHFLYSEWINDSGHCGLSRTPESRQLEETLMNVYNYTRFQSLELRVCFSGC